MNIAEISIRNRTVTLALTAVMIVAGACAYRSMIRLEDPDIAIREASVITPYRGASPTEVEEEVTDEIEKAALQLGRLEGLRSQSERGLSTVTVRIKDETDKADLALVWNELRHRVGDAQSTLPPGAGPSIVVDNLGDTFDIFVAIYGDEYTYAELKTYVDLIRRELLLVDGVAEVTTYGERVEAIYVDVSRGRMAKLGVTEDALIEELGRENFSTDSRRVPVGRELRAVELHRELTSVDKFASIPLSGTGAARIFLRDVATVTRRHVEPRDHLMRYDGNSAIGLGISLAAGGDEAVRRRMAELQLELPLGMEIGPTIVRSTAAARAIRSIVGRLILAVAFVVGVSVLLLGVRAGLIVGFVSVLTVLGSFVFLQRLGVALEPVSLGALIVVLGMLVDNAVVIVDGMLKRLDEGEKATQAAARVVRRSALPLLGATLVAIFAFAAVGTSPDKTGEFFRAFCQVAGVSLLLGWIAAVTITPLLGALFLSGSKGGESVVDRYARAFYASYKSLLHKCIQNRWITMAVVAGCFAASLYGFGKIDRSLLPPSTRPQFLVDIWMPKGTHIDHTAAMVAQAESYLLERDEVTHVTSLIGKGGLRSLPTHSPRNVDSAYAQLVVDVADASSIDGLLHEVEADFADRLANSSVYASKFQVGSDSTGKVQVRFVGPEPETLRRLAADATRILQEDADCKSIRNDWGRLNMLTLPRISEVKAGSNGIKRADIARTISEGFQGVRVGIHREEGVLLPIILSATADTRDKSSDVGDLQIWSPKAGRMIPLREVLEGVETTAEDGVIIRKDRKRTLTVYADPIDGSASALFDRVRPPIEALEMPKDHTLEWGGEYEDSMNARNAFVRGLPALIVLMVLVTIALFNNLRQPSIIWCCVPLAGIGVTVGLLTTGQPFGFVAVVGLASLVSMFVKNAVVFVDEINLQQSEGKQPLEAIVDSGAGRLRPVATTALATALAVVPLLFDALFVSMAVTIVFGLMFAIALTLVVLPVTYAIAYRVPATDSAN